MSDPENDHLSRSVMELGEPESLYRVQPARLLAKLGIGLSLLLFGVIANYWWWIHGPATFGHLELMLLIVVPLMGVTLLWHMYRHRGLHVLIYPAGLLRLIRGEVDSFPWGDIVMIHFRVPHAAEAEFRRDASGNLTACWMPVVVPWFKIWDAGITITRTDGTSISLGPVLSNYDALAEDVQRRTFARLWPSIAEHFQAGRPLLFDDLEISTIGLTTENKFLPWGRLGEVTVSQGKLSIKQKEKWLPWRLKDISTLPNPHVLYALLSEAKRGYASATEVTSAEEKEEG